MYRYQFRVGPHEFHYYGRDDRHAYRVLGRYLRIVWPKVKEHLRTHHPGSMADAEANGWYEDPEVGIWRVWSPVVTPCEPWPRLQTWFLNAETQQEWIRVWDAPRFS